MNLATIAPLCPAPQKVSQVQFTLRSVRLSMAVATAVFMTVAQGGQIVVGQVGPMSGLEAGQGRAYAAGMQLLFDTVNKAGGANGNTFILATRDDGGRPEDTVNVTRRLIAEERPLVLAGYFGNQNITSLMDSGVLEKEKIALVGYRAADLRTSTPYLYSIRAGLHDEIGKITEHLATIGVTRLGLLYEDGPDAAGVIAASDEAAAKAHVAIMAKASYPPGTARVSGAVEVFAKASPQAIIMVSNGAPAAAFIEQYRASGGSAQLFASSSADIEQLSKRLGKEQMQGVAIAQVTPSPYRISSRLAKELNDAAERAGKLDVPMSFAMMEGFIAAKVIVEAVRRQNAKVTREAMPATLESIGNYDAGGYVVAFKPGMHVGSRFVELSIVSSAGKIRQ